ncbi:MAG: hypothetical protein V4576_03615 [Patescibacteria group bacterium]
MNIFCTEIIANKYIKAISGSSVFLSDPDENRSVVLTNAHVARQLLDSTKKCVGRTGSPAATTHKLTLRYIPSFWLQNNRGYIIGDANKQSTGEFDFAIVEAERIQPKKKSVSIYDTLKTELKFQLQDYLNTESPNSTFSQGYIYSYPAEKTLSKNIYNPLYLKKDTMRIQDVFASPELQEPDSLLDAYGSTNIDHGSSGGMAILQNTSNNLIGLSSILIQPSTPQTVRIVSLKHIFSVMEKELHLSQSSQSDVYIQLLNTIKNTKISTIDFINVVKNQKLTATLELQTRKTLQNIGIISK